MNALTKYCASVQLCLFFAGNIHATTLDTWGTGTEVPPPVIPATHCPVLTLVSAEAIPGDNKLDKYRFVGTCNINVAPQGKPPQVKKIDVAINAEWFPQMKRASEVVIIKDSDLSVQLTTWATCNADPFVTTGASCSAQGIGASKFSPALRESDVPFAKGRTTASHVASLSAKTSAPGKFYENTKITAVQGATEGFVGSDAQFTVLVSGGNGVCPMELDYGDGSSGKSKPSDHGPNFVMSHVYAKPGNYTVTAKPLPGCEGHATWKVVIRTPTITGLSVPAEKFHPGEQAKFSVTGTAGPCQYGLDYGDGKHATWKEHFGSGKIVTATHTYAAPGDYQVKLTPEAPCVGGRSTSVKIAAPVVREMLPIQAVIVGEIAYVTVRGSGKPCQLRVSWGDGQTQEINNGGFDPVKGTVSLTHTYKSAGKFLVEAVGINGCLGLAAKYAQVNTPFKK